MCDSCGCQNNRRFFGNVRQVPPKRPKHVLVSLEDKDMDELEVPCMYEDYCKLCPGAPGRLLRHALWHNLRRRCGLLDKQLFYAAAGSKIDSIMLKYLRDLCAAAEPQIPLYICRLRQADVASGVMAFEYRYSRDHIVGLINKRKQNFLQAGRAAIAASRQLCTIKQRLEAAKFLLAVRAAIPSSIAAALSNVAACCWRWVLVVLFKRLFHKSSRRGMRLIVNC
ncbi:hypothetical protein U9M48_035319 [Paspalum notatum var. saurae]|uniref:Uncharacterized protein n=1 Tax=Paspalum notatum var. saurae TaxID=547442 RepID=A0AAQ3X7Q7_PASNO